MFSLLFFKTNKNLLMTHFNVHTQSTSYPVTHSTCFTHHKTIIKKYITNSMLFYTHGPEGNKQNFCYEKKCLFSYSYNKHCFTSCPTTSLFDNGHISCMTAPQQKILHHHRRPRRRHYHHHRTLILTVCCKNVNYALCLDSSSSASILLA